MNKFILNGSLYHLPPDKNRKVLVCDFACGLIRYSLKERYRAWTRGYVHADHKTFAEQVKWCDVLILNGGDSPTLIKILTNIQGWRENLHDKTIIAWSAGISALTTYSYNKDHFKVIEGLGILPLRSIVHFRDTDWVGIIALRRYKRDVELGWLLMDDQSVIELEY